MTLKVAIEMVYSRERINELTAVVNMLHMAV